MHNGDTEASRELGRSWHAVLRRPLKNEVLLDLLGLLKDHVERGRGLTSRDPASAVKSIEEHHAVLDAIEARDGELAERLLRAHLERVVADFEAEARALALP